MKFLQRIKSKYQKYLRNQFHQLIISVSESVQVNGQVLLIQGIILKFQLENFRSQSLMQIFKCKMINQNIQLHSYRGNNLQLKMLQIYLNRSDFEIDQYQYFKSILTNYLYTSPQINQELSSYYRIDLAEFQYCDPSNYHSTVFEYEYYCINYIKEKKFENCDLKNG
ncbi:unnamed protein product [Paramecium octaurelia]|uniref:Uncharacterized protein n=1 Tax=Paramecium octaurelia TaxID=43137 RepID=A0A8S1WCF5_PAROT|nr:unnamed protein product [Paramecium octaurelia]